MRRAAQNLGRCYFVCEGEHRGSRRNLLHLKRSAAACYTPTCRQRAKGFVTSQNRTHITVDVGAGAESNRVKERKHHCTKQKPKSVRILHKREGSMQQVVSGDGWCTQEGGAVHQKQG